MDNRRYQTMERISSMIKYWIKELREIIPEDEVSEVADMTIELEKAWDELDTHICDVINHKGYEYSGKESF